MNTPIFKNIFAAAVLALGLTQPVFSHGGEAHDEIGRKELNALYAAYLDIHQALFQDDFEAARTESRDFLRAPHKFPAELSHNVKAVDLVADLRVLNASRDVKVYRRNFQAFSDRMILLLSEAVNAGDMPVLVYHCPMAGNGEGANWLQAKEGVRNPYFGAGMPKCGSLTKTLHAGSAAAGEEKDRAGEKPGAGHEGHH